MSQPTVRTQAKYAPLSKQQFRERFFARFYDPAFDAVASELENVFEKAWDGYIAYRRTPREVLAGAEFAIPTFKLAVEWLNTRARIVEAEARHRNPDSPSRILIVNGSTRSEHTCPGEISKTRRLAQAALAAIEPEVDMKWTFSISRRLPTSR
jgi:hypothetical protein